jgi:hypothetical protein
MTDPNAPTATLIVSSSSATCGRCRQGALIELSRHFQVVDYGSGFRDPMRGCGAKFTAITTDQLGPAVRLISLVTFRPDLPTVIPEFMTIPGNAEAAEAEARLHVAFDEFRAAVIRWKDAGGGDPALHLAGEQAWEVAHAAAEEFDAAIARLRHETES